MPYRCVNTAAALDYPGVHAVQTVVQPDDPTYERCSLYRCADRRRCGDIDCRAEEALQFGSMLNTVCYLFVVDIDKARMPGCTAGL